MLHRPPPIAHHRVGGGLTAAVLSHHRTYGSVYGGSGYADIRHSDPCKYWALTIVAVLPRCAASSASCSSGQHFASGFLQIRSHPRQPCLWLALPLAGCVEDLHLQVVWLTTTMS
ncbi:hypothetical protein PspCFBP13509_26330 [Pseudomonas sp. CFBP13509]|nr:hypothetical protein PspCFBP13509_26330 [Pseudomonas sp. CFBP13509]